MDAALFSSQLSPSKREPKQFIIQPRKMGKPGPLPKEQQYIQKQSLAEQLMQQINLLGQGFNNANQSKQAKLD